jgi:hypothetical protein
VRGEDDLVTCPPVVETRRDVHGEAHVAPYGEHSADHAMTVRLARALREHEVLYLADAVGHQEARDEDVGVGEVELLRAPALAVGCDPETAAVVGVENRSEDAR